MAESWYRTAFGAFYPVLYAHRNDEEAKRCLALLPRLAPLVDRRALPVLDLGCGDGRHLSYLSRSGIATVGLDLSRPLLAAAARREPTSNLVRGDMRMLPCRDRAFGAVLSLFTAFGYFGRGGTGAAGDGDGAVAAGIGRVLADGGHWFLDYLDADRVRGELAGGSPERCREAGPLAVSETRSLNADGLAVVKEVRLTALPGHEAEAAAVGVGPGGLAYREEVALYAPDELDGLAGGGGMRRVAAAGGYRGEPLGAGSRSLLVYRKDEDAWA